MNSERNADIDYVKLALEGSKIYGKQLDEAQCSFVESAVRHLVDGVCELSENNLVKASTIDIKILLDSTSRRNELDLSNLADFKPQDWSQWSSLFDYYNNKLRGAEIGLKPNVSKSILISSIQNCIEFARLKVTDRLDFARRRYNKGVYRGLGI